MPIPQNILDRIARDDESLTEYNAHGVEVTDDDIDQLVVAMAGNTHL